MPLLRARVVIVIAAAFAVAALGVARLAASLATPATVDLQATVDSLSTRVVTAEWIVMDHDMSGDAPGYQMPPAMMPGMPKNGEERLAVAVTVVNTGDGTLGHVRRVTPARPTQHGRGNSVLRPPARRVDRLGGVDRVDARRQRQ